MEVRTDWSLVFLLGFALGLLVRGSGSRVVEVSYLAVIRPDIVEYEHVDLEQVAEKEQAASQAETDAKLAKRAAVSKFQQHIAEEALQHHTCDFSCLILLRQLNVCFWLSVCVKIRSVHVHGIITRQLSSSASTTLSLRCCSRAVNFCRQHFLMPPTAAS